MSVFSTLYWIYASSLQICPLSTFTVSSCFRISVLPAEIPSYPLYIYSSHSPQLPSQWISFIITCLVHSFFSRHYFKWLYHLNTCVIGFKMNHSCSSRVSFTGVWSVQSHVTCMEKNPLCDYTVCCHNLKLLEIVSKAPHIFISNWAPQII